MRGFPRKARELWSDSDYSRAIDVTRAELETFRSRFGQRADAEQLFSRSIGELEHERAELARRQAAYTTAPGDDASTQCPS